jgi:hypothetical protein
VCARSEQTNDRHLALGSGLRYFGNRRCRSGLSIPPPARLAMSAGVVLLGTFHSASDVDRRVGTASSQVLNSDLRYLTNRPRRMNGGPVPVRRAFCHVERARPVIRSKSKSVSSASLGRVSRWLYGKSGGVVVLLAGNGAFGCSLSAGVADGNFNWERWPAFRLTDIILSLRGL